MKRIFTSFMLLPIKIVSWMCQKVTSLYYKTVLKNTYSAWQIYNLFWNNFCKDYFFNLFAMVHAFRSAYLRTKQKILISSSEPKDSAAKLHLTVVKSSLKNIKDAFFHVTFWNSHTWNKSFSYIFIQKNDVFSFIF